jgi:hypothetical protein
MDCSNKIPYLKRCRNEFLDVNGKWKDCNGAQGCVVVERPDVCLSMEKEPPRLKGAVEKAPPPPPPVQAASSKELNPSPADLLEQNNQTKDKRPAPPAFDLQDVPKGMRAMGFYYAAEFAERWFKGRASFVPKPENENEKKPHYDRDMVDADTITLKWAFKFRGVEKNYNALLTKEIFTENAKVVMFDKFKKLFAENSKLKGEFE